LETSPQNKFFSSSFSKGKIQKKESFVYPENNERRTLSFWFTGKTRLTAGWEAKRERETQGVTVDLKLATV
jgi:hypothetical protein